MALFPESLGKLRFLPLTILVLLALGLIFFGWERWQTGQIDQLRDDLAKGNFDQALELADTLETLALNKREVRRLKALALQSSNPQLALDILTPMIKDVQAADYEEMVLTYLEIAIDSDLLEQAEAAAQNHLPQLGIEPDFLYWLTILRLKQGESLAAIEMLDRTLSIDSEHPRARILRAQLLLDLGGLADIVQAKVNLRIAAKDQGEAGREALLLLSASPRVPLFPNDRQWLVYKLQARSQNDAELGFLAANQEIILNPDKRSKIISYTVAEYSAVDPTMTADWLISTGEFDALQSFLASDAAKLLDNDSTARIRMQILFAKGDFEQARALIESSPKIYTELQREILIAEIDHNSAPSATATDQWQRTVALAKEAQDGIAMTHLARIAHKSRWLPEATSAYNMALSFNLPPAAQAQILQDKFTVDLTQGNTSTALQDARDLLNLTPQNGVMINNAYYLEALLDDMQLGEMPRPTPKQVEQFDGYIWSTYALAMWRLGKPALAEEALQELPLKFHDSPSCQLISFLVAVDLGQIDKARALLDSIRVEALLPEERQLLQEAKQSLRS